jgi:type VI secretion system secreted protein Hcp
MKCTIGIVALALIICPGSVDAGTPERTVVMKIGGVPGQFTVQVDQDGWSQLQALQAPGAPSGSGSSNPLSARGTSSLASRGSGGGRSGPAGIQEITITKTDDKSSPNLASWCSTGKHYSEVTLQFVDTAGGNERGYTSYELVNAVVGSFHTGSTGSEGQQTETLTINFTEIRVADTQSERGWGEAEQRATPPPYTYTPRHR